MLEKVNETLDTLQIVKEKRRGNLRQSERKQGEGGKSLDNGRENVRGGGHKQGRFKKTWERRSENRFVRKSRNFINLG